MREEPDLGRPRGRVPPGQVLTEGFPVLHAGTVPRDLRPGNWSQRIHGAVARPQELRFTDLLTLSRTDEVADIHCVTSWSKLGTRWAGVAFSEIDQRAKPAPEVGFVVMECEQGFTTSLPLATLREPGVLLAFEYDGKPLPAEHGGPVRMLVPQRYFYKSAKWLRGLRFVKEDEPGFWEVRGYSNIADPWQGLRYDVDDVRLIHRMRKQNLFRPLG